MSTAVQPATTPTRATLGGSSIIMACACGTASSTMKLMAIAGIAATTKVLHPVFFSIGAALIVYGLWRTARQSAYMSVAAFAILGAGAWLTPPGKMTMKGSEMAAGHPGIPWNATQMFGASLYVVGIALLAYAFWRAFPARKPKASAAAIGGMAVATGCTCCLVEGAIAGMAVTAGASSAIETVPIIFWGAMAIVAVAIYRLGGWKAALWVPAGAFIVKYAPEALKLTPNMMVGTVNLRFVPSYIITVLGLAVVMYAFAKAYRPSQAVQYTPAELSQAA
ncbi:MAG TPA: hypothetical protein VGQ98_02145 [Gemmatimonadaceae bacterium]|nr:hypothetical protein [Gemmatimonadaceae bacterium]